MACSINEFAMMWALKDRFPLHYIVFKQCASHIPHEANAEQLFSPGPACSQTRTSTRTSPGATHHHRQEQGGVQTNGEKAILDKYCAKYRGNSAASSADDVILDGWGSLPF